MVQVKTGLMKTSQRKTDSGSGIDVNNVCKTKVGLVQSFMHTESLTSRIIIYDAKTANGYINIAITLRNGEYACRSR